MEESQGFASPSSPGPSSRFASDNTAGVHPAVLAAIAAANASTAPSYGLDAVTSKAVALLRAHFGRAVEVAFALTGTAANIIALAALLRPHEAALCASTAHVLTDEAGAPERFLGSKLVGVPTPDGRLTVPLLAAATWPPDDPHRPVPRAVSLAQPTELGTVYSMEALREIAAWTHANDMLLHVDGARLSNAAVSLDVDLQAFASCGIDVLTFGGTKNGALGAEAVLFLNPSLAAPRHHLQKQTMQLTSKMRFVAAQLAALLEDDLWRTNATQANTTAAALSAAASALPAVTLAYPTQSNAVFATLPPAAAAHLHGTYTFEWHPASSTARWMTAFDTTPSEVEAFAEALQASLPH
ncbi:beta-eliminating lyase-related protein [Dactylosporangium sp. AC04546]|uniref:threonine aldolase family protein n=1 Tax=Dactylosporangium sp. AC04546 TaxID=2862460 RepID=UPI001EE0E24B|nr:beta-eliminating lyase-related protein [Dactylosporangium sp. AC04546]WVK80142.1 beta-eliminating lyase-related protein [Dactylosporangium sp. AC04546]